MNDDKLNQTLRQLGAMAKAQRLQQEEQLKQAQKTQKQDIDFAQMMHDVKPLKPCNQYQHPRDMRHIRRRVQNEDDLTVENYFYVGQDQHGEPPSRFSKNGRGTEDIRRLQAKYWPIVGYVDLHGYNQQQAQEVLNEFVEYISRRGVVGEIIHGSGLGSKDYEPVLKNLVRRWLMAHPQVIAYAQPHEHNDGAVYVLVKKRR
ncbi:Smr/MutS family protein [Neisseriaceae bacterium ESL0693]|nr:Smr/MutS family protein [Neisseriaceae bacterium ESL0693]